MTRLYLSPPDVGEAERDALLAAFDSNWIAPLGPEVDGFESDAAIRCGRPAAAALASGTAALHLALLLAGVRPGDRVAVPTLTFVAPANAVRYCGAEPLFVDSEAATWGMDPDLLSEALAGPNPPTAVIAVDLFGQCAQLDIIEQRCREAGVPLIEDAAEALGATWGGRPAGSFGDYAALSFNGNKIITTSGGGMLLGAVEDMARARGLAAQARLPALHYEHEEVGYNYRLSNLLAALGRAQLAGLNAKVAARRAVNARYREALAGLEGVDFMPSDPRGEPSCWLTVATLDGARATPVEVCEALATHDIEARPTWKPMHAQPVFAEAEVLGGAVADGAYRTGLCLPSGSGMSTQDIDRVVGHLRMLLA